MIISVHYIILCGGKLRSGITHPNVPNSMFVVLFDSTHNLKNIYNNWLNGDSLIYRVVTHHLSLPMASEVLRFSI